MFKVFEKWQRAIQLTEGDSWATMSGEDKAALINSQRRYYFHNGLMNRTVYNAAGEWADGFQKKPVVRSLVKIKPRSVRTQQPAVA